MSEGDRKSTILIVDDNPSIYNLLKLFLKKDDYTILTTDNGYEALRLVKEHQPDLLLLDIMMPGLTGFQVCEELMADPRTADIHVIFISAKKETEDRIRGLEMGAVDYITKPFELSEVRARVKLHLKLKRTQRMLEEKGRKLEALTARSSLSDRDDMMEPLLEICERGAFRAKLSEEFDSASNGFYHLCLLLMKIDQFNEYNEFCGREAGNQVLRTVIEVQRKTLRRQDFFWRYGGNEFVIMLPRISLQTAKIRAEGLCDVVRQERIRHDHNKGLGIVTVSIGGAWSYPPDGERPGAVLAAATEALGQARDSGEGSVVFWDADEPWPDVQFHNLGESGGFGRVPD